MRPTSGSGSLPVTTACATQIEAMQQRAGQRLGENFGGEIGAKHRHEVLTREVLARYFTFAGAPATEDQGRYAEITSAADLYFKSDGAPFRLPLTVIETPGVNDPFLVRDEISRRAFESADVHIAVLNARQPLSAAELAHLRILRGLHKDRIVVFINRIDELADVVIDTRRVLAEVRQTLEHEFPGAEIPVVAGSARWGTLAIEPELSDDQDVLTPALLASARHKRVLPRVGIEDGDADEAAEDISTDQLRRALSVCSGFEELSVALNQVLLRCHSAHLIRQVASYFAELAQLNEASLREEHRRDVEQAEMMAAESIERQRDLQRMQAELACIRQIAAEVERRLGGLQSSLNDIVLEQRNSLLDGVFAFFQQFVEAEGEKLLNEVGSGRAVRQWRCDTTPLRHVVEEQLERARQTAEDRLRQSADNIFPVLREAMLRRFPYLNLPPPPDADGVIAGAVSVTLPDSVALDGGRGLWSLGKARGISAEEPDRELEWALREAFVPAIEELIRSADSRLEQHARESSDYAAATSVAVMEALRKESDMLIARAAQLLEAQQARAVEDQELDKRTAQQREQLVIAEALNRRLSEVCQRCNELVG